ncbi:phosphoesterase [Trebonia kvetii]|uniref:Phosphoesterase n=1 Tax=Trebonia kvetii TaxID=2480626 RepID=A0A6P2C5Z6_9ACTN|nr:phosphoesterase [Trebonia kvetii]
MGRTWRCVLAVALALVLAACTNSGSGTRAGAGVSGSGPVATAVLRTIRHVWVIDLENLGYVQTFGSPSADPYLARTLPRTGALLKNYYAIGHSSAANYIAQVSGQAPDLATQADCPLWTPFPAAVTAGPYHQVLGEGCVYPAAVPTLGNQLSDAGLGWAAYLQDMGNDPVRDHTTATARGPACGHPAAWAADRTNRAAKADQYAVRHDGFAFFRAVTANQAFCAAHLLSTRPLPGDLARASTTPAFSFIVPNLCNDGHDSPCVTGAPGGLAQANRFLSQWVPKIMAAPAYQDGGLIVITFDEGSDAAACCGETSGLSPAHPNVPEPGKNGPGGGRVGAVLLSPLIRPGTVSTVDYNHYSLLRTVEDIFGLPHLGDAAMPQVRSFGSDVFG